jgi:two-component system, NtrC family, response regulator HydG
MSQDLVTRAALQVDIRIIAATNRDLPGAVKTGAFREDLFFRLHVIPLRLPPLQARPEDLPRLADYFVHKHSLELKRPGMQLSSEALECLQHYHWPGNVRELENVIERAVVLSRGEVIQPEDLALPAPESSPPGDSAVRYQTRLEAMEREVLRDALQAHGGDKRASALAVGMALSTFYAKLKKYHL